MMCRSNNKKKNENHLIINVIRLIGKMKIIIIIITWDHLLALVSRSPSHSKKEKKKGTPSRQTLHIQQTQKTTNL